MANTTAVIELNAVRVPAWETCVHWLFEHQVRQNPRCIAACSTNDSLTYRELNQYAEVVAARLIEAGTKPQDNVALSFEHSIWTVVAMLGVWKAGAAIAPIPAGPAARVATLVEILKPTVILTSEDRRETIDVDPMFTIPTMIVAREQLQSSLGQCPRLRVNVDPNQVAYTMFTSGSTGVPKGAQIEHKQFATYVTQWSKALGITNGSRVFGWCAYLFDVSMSDIWAPLTSGATLCVPSEFDRLNRIPQSMRELRVTHAEFVPSVLATILPDEVDLEHLKVISMVGEKPIATVVDRWASISGLSLINAYGPAECCPHASISNLSTQQVSPSNIGNSLGPGLWIVNPDNVEELRSFGEEGELIIEGAFVGRGYLNEPEKTRNAFITAPEWLQAVESNSSSRLYRTGDICRYTQDGSIEYIARNDTQIKLGGQRMEIGEVEYNLRCILPDKADSAVVLGSANNNGQNPKLIAFVALDGGHSTTHGTGAHGLTTDEALVESLNRMKTTVVEELKRKLPAFMVPSVFVAMSHIPRLASGKVSRNSLTVSAGAILRKSMMESASTNDAQLSPIGEQIRTVWSQVFEFDESNIGPRAHFFRLGGDSVQALRVRSALFRLGISITMKEIFDFPVLADLATVALKTDVSDTALPNYSLLPPDQVEDIKALATTTCQIDTEDIEDIFHALGSACYFMLTSETVPTGWMLFNSYPIGPEVDLERYLKCWRSVISTYSNLRSRIVLGKTGIWQVVLKEEKEIIRTADSMKEHFKHEQSTKMTWGQSLSRYCIVTDKETGARNFVWTASHAIHDNWTIDLIYRKVQEAYFSNNTQMIESLKTNAVVQMKMKADPAPAKAWFRKYFNGAMPTAVFNVPKGYKFVKDTEEEWTFDLPLPPADVSETQANITISTIVSVAWAMVLAQRAGVKDICLNLIRSGRNLRLPGTDKFIGALAGYLPARVKIEENLTVVDLLSRYQNDWIESSEFDSYSWVELLEEDTPPAVKGACAMSIGLNIVPADTEDDEELLEVVPDVQQPNTAAIEPSNLPDTPPLLSTSSGSPSVQSDSDLDTEAASLSSSQTSLVSQPSPDVKSETLINPSNQSQGAGPVPQRYTRSYLFPHPEDHHLGPSQNPVNINVFLPKTQSTNTTSSSSMRNPTRIRTMLRRDLNACTAEIADAFVKGVEIVAAQLITAKEGMQVREITVPDTRHIEASRCTVAEAKVEA